MCHGCPLLWVLLGAGPSPVTHGSCTASWGRWQAWGIDKLSLGAPGRSIWCAEKRRHLTYLCENRNCGRPSSSVVAADNVCVCLFSVFRALRISRHALICLFLVEGTSVYKLQQGWSVLNIRCSIEPAQREGGASGCPVLDRKLQSLCLVLSFFLFLQMHQHTQPCKHTSCLLGKLQPALVVQAFELAVQLRSCASTCIWSWDVWASASSFRNSFSGSDDRNEIFSIMVEVGCRKSKTVDLNTVN